MDTGTPQEEMPAFFFMSRWVDDRSFIKAYMGF